LSEFLALLLTDVVDSTRIAEAVGDAVMTAHWVAHDRAARDLLRTWRGREVDKTDGLMAVFDSAADAAAFAIDYHRALAALGVPFKARAGVHVGSVTLRENSPADVLLGARRFEVDGVGVSIAARAMAAALGGQTLLTADARRALGDTRFRIESHGFWRLKGLNDPVELFEIGDAQAPFTPPPEADKAYRVLLIDGLWQPLRTVRHNLPPERDAFVGRVAELQGLALQLQAGTRLLCLLGPGGTGKTRLARRYALAWLGEWPGGVYFCDLSEARGLDGIYFAVASALGVPLGKGDPAAQLGHAIAGRGRCLLILDNFEQVQQHAVATVGRWLDRAGEAAFVVTSRERLHLEGEQVLVVEPLRLDGEAIELFAVRARAQRPGFEVDDGNRSVVAEVARLLDGLPLAIELSAARMRVLSPAQIVERLKDRFALLAGVKGAAKRQATLRAAIDWSWDLLAPWEQNALAQCSVFEGGFTLAAAEAVLDLRAWPEAPPPMDAVQSLVDKSLLRFWVPAQAHGRLSLDEPYFGMYLSIHEYAAEKLQLGGADEVRRVQERHGRCYARHGASDAVAALGTHEGVGLRQALAFELENLIAACRRAVQRCDPEVAAPSYRAIWEVLHLQGPFAMCLELGSQVLALDGVPARSRIDVEFAMADVLLRVGRIDDSRALLEHSLARARELGDRRREGLALGLLGDVDREQGRMDRARTNLEAALAIHREVGNARGQATVLQNLGNLLDQRGEASQSRSCHESALAIFTALGHRHGVAQVRASLGILNRHQGRMDEAREHYEAALAIFQEVGDRRSEGIALGNLANLLDDQGHSDEARVRHEAALAIHREVGSRVVEAYALGNIGLLHCHLGRRDEARACLEQALAIDRETSNRIHEGVVLLNLGELDLAEGRFAEAQARLDQAQLINRATGDRLGEGMALGLLGELARRTEGFARALEVLGEGEALMRAIDDPVELAHLLCSKVRAALDAGDHELARTTLAEVAGIAKGIAATADSRLAREIDKLRVTVGS
jgi:predicted ATPase/class 3 adenylate cyclase/Tfp pilus assembly protein PilF